MKKISTLISLLMLACILHAQVKNVIVETYYIADAIDAADTVGGGLPEGSVTYRVFIEMVPGSKLLKLYGDASHALIFESDKPFYNHKTEGKTLAKDFNKNRFGENTVALDSWITLGQVSKTSSMTYFGVPKTSDKNGSILGGAKNDEGMLANTNAEAGIPLTIADGLDTSSSNVPTNWVEYGFTNPITKEDSTIFGSVISGKTFVSHNCYVSNSGVQGLHADSNIVLVAQLTTKGKLSFELNVELEQKTDGYSSKIVKYVAVDNGTLADDEVVSPYLKYPLECGCKDPNYLEYSPNYGCNDISKCKTLVVLGCMDPMACNFDPKANVNMSSMCCYPGYCNDRDISIVCPAINNSPQVYFYPNPSSSNMTIKIDALKGNNVRYTITGPVGNVVKTKDLGSVLQSILETIDISSFESGIYHCAISIDDKTETHTIIKQ